MDLNHARLPIPPYLHIMLAAFCDFDIVSQKNRFVNGRKHNFFGNPPRSAHLHFGEDSKLLYIYMLKAIGGS